MYATSASVPTTIRDPRRRSAFAVLFTALFVVTLSSLASALAASTGAFITARIAQGLAAPVMAQAALLILVTAFAQGVERHRALGTWARACIALVTAFAVAADLFAGVRIRVA